MVVKWSLEYSKEVQLKNTVENDSCEIKCWNPVEKHSLEIQWGNTVEKNNWKIQLKNTVCNLPIFNGKKDKVNLFARFSHCVDLFGLE